MRLPSAAIITIFLFVGFDLGSAAQERIGPAEAAKYIGKTATVCGQKKLSVTGMIISYQGKPEIVVRNPSQITVE